MTLVKAISDLLPVSLSQFGKAAVNAYAALPGVAGWTPPAGFQPFQAQRVVELGWPLTSAQQILLEFILSSKSPC